MAATIIDVARHAGVSIATVSRVMNGTTAVRPDTRQRVAEAIEALGYRPNQLARSLPGGQSDRVIGLVIPEINNPVFPEIAQAVEHEARHQGYQVMLCQTDDRWAIELKYAKLLIDRRVSGIIFVSGSFSHVKGDMEPYRLVREANIPYVLVNSRASDSTMAPVLATDEVAAGKMQAAYLLQHGHRHIGFLGGGLGYYVTRDRLLGVNQAMASLARGETASLTQQLGGFQQNRATLLARTLLTQNPRPTGILCASDLLAMIFMTQARHMGLRIPDDLSVIGFDGIQMVQHTWPPLTTIAQPLRKMGTLAVKSVLGQPINPRLELTLIKGQSVGAVPSNAILKDVAT